MKSAIIKIRENNADRIALPKASDILRNIYHTRGISSLKELDYSLEQLPSPALMKSNISAAKLLANSISEQKKILVVADFDVDGATSCALMLLALKCMGATNVHYLVPDRFKFGYGLTAAIVDVAAELTPDLIITVDNGISSIEGVDRANQLAIDVLITDHHLPGQELPKAKTIVNPNQPGCEFPSKALAGVGVAFYLLLAVRMQLRKNLWFKQQDIQEPNLTQFLDLVALGTIADLAPLDHCNRILVDQGLRRIRTGRCRAGISALISIANKDSSCIQSADLGFAIGPRLNAAGRLDDMSLGIECLLTVSDAVAYELASKLDSLNKQRREIESTMQKQALKCVEQLTVTKKLDKEIYNFSLCLYQTQWHQGIIGLLASRIKDLIYRPVIAFADANPDPESPVQGTSNLVASVNEDNLLKGSARSIPGLHLRDVLDKVARENPQLLNKFGGHAMAAGMTIQKRHLQEFSVAFDTAVATELQSKLPDNIIWSDGELPINEITMELARELREAGPWGQMFEEPRFHGEFRIISKRILSGKHLKFQMENKTGRAIDGIAFFQDEELLNSKLEDVRLIYKIDINSFRGQENLQLIVEQIVPL